MSFESFANKRRIIFDGAIGTYLQKINSSGNVVGGMFSDNTSIQMINITSPQIVIDMHRSYLYAGADVISTNTFQANAISLKTEQLSNSKLVERVTELNVSAVQCAREAMKGFSNKFIALSIGSGSLLPSIGQVSYDELYSNYYDQIFAGASAGVDILLIETCQDLLQIKSALNAARKACHNLGVKQPTTVVSLTVSKDGNLLLGTDMKCVMNVLKQYDIYALGLNCSFGPKYMDIALEAISKLWHGRIYLSPSAGVPEIKGGVCQYPFSSAEFAELTSELVKKYDIALVGGCCGTDEQYINDLVVSVRKLHDYRVNYYTRQSVINGIDRINAVSSGYSSVNVEQEPPPLLVQSALTDEVYSFLNSDDYESVVQLIREQSKSVHVVEVQLSFLDRSELDDINNILPKLNSELTAPIMFTSTSPDAISHALKMISGKPILSVMGFEDGGERLFDVINMLEEYPAMVMIPTVDEEGIARSAGEKLEIAKRIYRLWTNEFNKPEGELIVNFTISSVAALTSLGDNSEIAAKNTLEAMGEFKNLYPGVHTSIRINDVSFGLSNYSRSVLNAVFLSVAVDVGLDIAIVDKASLATVSTLSEEEVRLAEDVINAVDGALDRFITHFSKIDVEIENIRYLPLDEQLRQKILSGDNSKLSIVVNNLLRRLTAHDIFEKIVMSAMTDVKELYSSGDMLLPFVLKSIEVVSYINEILNIHFTDEDGDDFGEILIASVLDEGVNIEKRLIQIILEGNGYSVANIGTVTTSQEVLSKVIDTSAKAIYLCGHSVKALNIINDLIKEISDAKLDTYILLSGNIFKDDFVKERCSGFYPGKVFYIKDAFSVLDVLKRVSGVAEEGDEISQTLRYEQVHSDDSVAKGLANVGRKGLDARASFDTDMKTTLGVGFNGYIEVDRLNNNIYLDVSIEDIYSYIDKGRLYEYQWKYSAGVSSLDIVFSSMLDTISDVLEMKVAYGFYKAIVKGEEMWIDKGEELLFGFFPKLNNTRSLAEIFLTKSGFTAIPIVASTLGSEAQYFINKLNDKKMYVDSMLYEGLFKEISIALLRYVESSIIAKKIRLKNEHNNEVEPLLKRFTFGHPSCPDIIGTSVICELLEAQKIGVRFNNSNNEFKLKPNFSKASFFTWNNNTIYDLIDEH